VIDFRLIIVCSLVCFRMSQRASKRHRAALEGGSYRHTISFGTDDFLDVHAREDRLIKLGLGFKAPPLRVSHKSDEQWRAATSWAPLDDPNFGLDSNDACYDEVVDAVGPAEAVVEQKKKRSKVAVSLSAFRLVTAC
jgi:hypothetical protein